jgi:cytochrome bd ubiquinol oxidase subunit II
VVRSDVPELYDDLTSGPGLACVLASGAAGLGTLWLEWRERFEVARYTAAAAVAAIIAGWAFAQEPYLLPPGLTVEEAAAPDATLTALLIAATLGMALLLPALAWLFRLALSGRLAYEEEPRA